MNIFEIHFLQFENQRHRSLHICIETKKVQQKDIWDAKLLPLWKYFFFCYYLRLDSSCTVWGGRTREEKMTSSSKTKPKQIKSNFPCQRKKGSRHRRLPSSRKWAPISIIQEKYILGWQGVSLKSNYCYYLLQIKPFKISDSSI